MKFNKIATRGQDTEDRGHFLKIEPGKSVIGVLRGEVHQFWYIWPQGGKKQEFDQPTAGAAMRFKANFAVPLPDGKSFEMRVWEFGVTIYNLLAEMSQHMKVEETKISISRQGSGKEDTRYTVMPIGRAADRALEQISQMSLHILGAKPKQQEEPETSSWDDNFGEPPHDMNNENELPF